MIQTLAPDRTDQPFDVSPLPRRPRRREHLLDALRFHLIHELLAEDLVAITEKVARRTVPRERFPHLLRRPLCGCTRGDCEMHNGPPVGCQYQKYIQDLESTVGIVKKSTETMLRT